MCYPFCEPLIHRLGTTASQCLNAEENLYVTKTYFYLWGMWRFSLCKLIVIKLWRRTWTGTNVPLFFLYFFPKCKSSALTKQGVFSIYEWKGIHGVLFNLKHSWRVKSSNITVFWRVWITCFHYKTKLAWVYTCEYKSHMFHHILAMQKKEAMTFIFSFWQLPPKNILVLEMLGIWITHSVTGGRHWSLLLTFQQPGLQMQN